MGKIELLDCTLRDGGYINSWNFGEKAIKTIIENLAKARIEYIEAGFVRPCTFDKNRTIFDSGKNLQAILPSKKSCSKYAGMIDIAHPVPIDSIPENDGSGFDTFRIMFKKWQTEEALEYSRAVANLGYETFAQVVATHLYSEDEFKEIIGQFNSTGIKGFYIVDSYGLMKKNDFLSYLETADRELAPAIAVGYHSHNNLSQAFENARAMAEFKTERDRIIDASIMGMGRGAGNLDLETFADFMNRTAGTKYSTQAIADTAEEYIKPIHESHPWGTTECLSYSAENKCHPNYAIWYSAKADFTMEKFIEVVGSLSDENKVHFSPENADSLWNK